jgi:hypothetical protein
VIDKELDFLQKLEELKFKWLNDQEKEIRLGLFEFSKRMV